MSKYSIEIPIELQDRLSHEFDRLSAVVKGKEQVIRNAMASVKDRSTESMTAIKAGIESLGKAKVDLRNLEALRKEMSEVANGSSSAANQTRIFYQELLKSNAAQSKAAGSAKGLKTEIDGVSQSSIRAANIFKSVLGANLVTGAFYSLISAGRSLIGTFIDANIQYEQSSVAFEVMLGSATKAKVLLAQVSQFAAETPFQLPELNAATKALLAFGSGAGTVVQELRRIGDISSGVSAPIGEIAAIYGKARVQGRLFAEDINQFTGRGIPVIQEFAKILGVAENKVKDMGAKGLITFDTLDQAFVNLTSSGGRFNGMMAKQSLTLGGLISTIKDDFTQVLRDIGEGGLMDKLRSIAKDTADWFSVNSEKVKAFANELGSKLGNAISFTLNHMGELLDIGKAFFIVFSVVKLAQLVLGINTLGIALKALVLTNPILAGVSLLLLAGVTAYTQITRATEDFNDENKKLKEGEDLLFSYNKQLERTKTLSEKVADLHKKAMENNPFAFVGTPVEEKKKQASAAPVILTEAQKKHSTEMLALKEEAAKISAKINLNGKELEIADEKAAYTKRLALAGKFTDSIKIINQIHKDALTEIDQKYSKLSEAARKADALSVGAEYAKFLESKSKLQDEIENLTMTSQEREVKQIKDHYAALLKEAEAHFFNKKELKEKTDIIEKAQSESIKIQEKKQAIEKYQNAYQMASNIMQTGDMLFAHSRKNAILHKTLAIGEIAVNTARAIMATLGTGGYLAIPLAFTIGALGVAQAAVVARQKFERGGPVGGAVFGRNHSQGGVPIEVEGGEFIFSRRDVQNAGGAGALEAMRHSQFKNPGSAGGNNVSVTYAPVYPSGADSYGPSFTEAARRDKVEFGRFMEKELKAKGYVN